MKKLILSTLTVLISVFMYAQDLEYTNHFTLVTLPLDYNKGISAGFQYEYQNNTIYVGPEILMKNDEFPVTTYVHYIGRFGFNKHFGRLYTTSRVFAGGRAGIISRSDAYYIVGLEGGVDVFIPRTPVYVRFSFTSDLRSDIKGWSTESNHTVNTGVLGVGVSF